MVATYLSALCMSFEEIPSEVPDTIGVVTGTSCFNRVLLNMVMVLGVKNSNKLLGLPSDKLLLTCQRQINRQKWPTLQHP